MYRSWGLSRIWRTSCRKMSQKKNITSVGSKGQESSLKHWEDRVWEKWRGGRWSVKLVMADPRLQLGHRPPMLPSSSRRSQTGLSSPSPPCMLEEASHKKWISGSVRRSGVWAPDHLTCIIFPDSTTLLMITR